MAFVKLFINSIEKTLYEADLTKEGERAIDQIRLIVPKLVNPEVNQEIKYLQDMVDIGKLIAVYNLQGNVEDEGGYGHDGVATSLTFGTDSWDGQSATFNGTSWTAEEDFPNDAADNMSAYAYGNFAAGGRESFLAFANTDSLTNVAFTYDGESWEAAGTLADPVMYAGSGGDSSSAMSAGGADNGWDVVTSQLYNGTTFTSKPDIDVGVTGGGMGANTV